MSNQCSEFEQIFSAGKSNFHSTIWGEGFRGSPKRVFFSILFGLWLNIFLNLEKQFQQRCQVFITRVHKNVLGKNSFFRKKTEIVIIFGGDKKFWPPCETFLAELTKLTSIYSYERLKAVSTFGKVKAFIICRNWSKVCRVCPKKLGECFKTQFYLRVQKHIVMIFFCQKIVIFFIYFAIWEKNFREFGKKFQEECQICILFAQRNV